MTRLDHEKNNKKVIARERNAEAADLGWRGNGGGSAGTGRTKSFGAAIGIGGKKGGGKTAYKKVLKRYRQSDPRQKADGRKVAFLHEVVRCELLGLDIPEVPRKWPSDFGLDVARKGGALEWARTQANYGKIKERKAKKLGLRAEEPVVPCVDEGPAGIQVADFRAEIEKLAASQQGLRELLSNAQSELERVDEKLSRFRRLVELTGIADESGPGTGC